MWLLTKEHWRPVEPQNLSELWRNPRRFRILSLWYWFYRESWLGRN